MNDWLAILLVVVLLLLNAFFVGAEFTLISSRRDRLEALLEQGKTRAKIVINASRHVSLMLAGAQLGITICSLLLGRLGEPAVAHRLGGFFALLHVPEVLVHAISFAIALAFITVLHVLIGEMVPKNLAIADPERLALWLVPVHVGWVKLARPFIWLLNFLANSLLRSVKVEPKDELETAYTSAELAELLSESRREGLLEQSEHERLSQTLSSVAKTVADVLVPLHELTTLSPAPTVGEVEKAVSETGFSRYPLCSPAGELIGYLHVKDVLDQIGDDPGTTIAPDKIRALTDLPVAARLDEALSAMRAEGTHLARVLDTEGRPVGVVALEDLVEEYVGTVRDGTHVAA
ncbi:CBS domain containing-hemolysin-like protein [Amycolatopsis bartoniae]|uniref:Membrane protein n=1 Tax=Amycolatopsis bartoniae TaxID=941986 RepID=A0A8H9MDC4_9PSEU|nr:hemolysin family protein [Amycolatopsis bartoniae]MBB2936923.1 CBS domain containing-hemolysin-like protein [Amycolatopsis bartoniae]TVT01704.1 HlyC/CorC family transporter [Amycolatopsis bartoniae]GHF51218.1 membrane protein [Amycolatopsis bartoniae]